MSSAILNQCNFHSVPKHRWKSHLHPFAAYMNKQHRCVKFTSKTEKNNTCFLDINKTRQNNQLKTFVYRKPTFSDVLHTTKVILVNLTRSHWFLNFLSRCFSVCSDYTLFYLEVGKWREILKNNSYPSGIIEL